MSFKLVYVVIVYNALSVDTITLFYFNLKKCAAVKSWLRLVNKASLVNLPTYKNVVSQLSPSNKL